jgi:prolipoprotein diacylglyceryltransferase
MSVSLTEAMAPAIAGPYHAFYLAAFAIAVALAAREGSRRGWPLGPWLTVVAAAALGGIAGSKLLHLSLAHALGAKTFLGGLIGGTLALAAAARVVRLDGRAADALGPAVFSGLAVGKVGCLLAGCCFGLPTHAPWGVVYSAASPAGDWQRAAGILAHDAVTALPVVPTQAFEAIVAAALALLAARGWRTMRRPGTPFLATAGGYGVARVLAESVRAEGSATRQLVVAALVAAALVAIARRERGPSPQRPAPRWDRTPLVAAGLSIVVLAALAGLTPLERLAALLVTLVPLAATALAARRGTVAAPLAPAVACSLLLLQAVPEQTPTASAPRTWVTLGVGASTGRYEESCGGIHDYHLGAASVGVTREWSRHTSLTIRASGFGGSDQEEFNPGAMRVPDPPIPIRGGMLRLGVDGHYLGLALGAQVGDLAFDGAPESVLPVAALRVGSLTGFFAEGHLWDADPAAVPAPAIQIGLGGMVAPGLILRGGVADAGVYAGGVFVSRQGLEVEPLAAFGGDETFRLAVALRLRLGWKR